MDRYSILDIISPYCRSEFRFRLIINTKSNLLLYNFETVEWDYSAPAERVSDFVKKAFRSSGENHKHSNAFARAQRVRRQGAELTNSRLSTDSLYSPLNYEPSKRVQSAPPRRTDAQGIQKHIARIQSAVAARKPMNQNDRHYNSVLNNSTDLSEEISRKSYGRDFGFLKEKDRAVKNAWENVPDSGIINQKSDVIRHGENMDENIRKPSIVARSRSAPAYRVRSLPPTERGFTSSSDVNVKVWENKLNQKRTAFKEKSRPFSASVTTMQNPVDIHNDLKLKTFYQQIQFENALASK